MEEKLSRPELFGHSRRANNLAPFKIDIVQTFTDYDTAGENLIVCAAVADNVRRSYFACGNLSLLAPYFVLFQQRLSAPYRYRPWADAAALRTSEAPN
jgi:hypothetical protein